MWYVINIGCALLFMGIGVFAFRLEKPMWFWAGSTVDPDTITDVKAYNKANGWMWMGYSLWYWLSALVHPFYPPAAIALLVLGSTLGIGLLLWIYHRIEKKYKK